MCRGYRASGRGGGCLAGWRVGAGGRTGGCQCQGVRVSLVEGGGVTRTSLADVLLLAAVVSLAAVTLVAAVAREEVEQNRLGLRRGRTGL